MPLTVLHIDSSVAGERSASRKASKALVASRHPDRVLRRDLTEMSLPFIDGAWAATRLKAQDDLTDADREVLALSDALIAELQDADEITIGVPLYNFSIPASLKAWIDLVARPKVTFRYGDNGPVGLLKGKKATIAIASGGIPVGSAQDFATPHLKVFLDFLGITDVTIIDAKAT